MIEASSRAAAADHGESISMLYAHFTTSEGNFTIQLFDDKAPKTVANFTGLAEGTKEWTDPRSGKKVKQPFYNGLIFHRVISGFMIQGGDPLGTGTGGPGYKFGDETHPDLTFNRPYLLAMANAGPGTNGSQFFITTVPTPWLTGKHTIFGEVVQGADIVDKISNARTDSRDRPANDVVIESVEITGDDSQESTG
jgi:peptidyl-prolyl cis-trans isomerase A (cyclophilin A)